MNCKIEQATEDDLEFILSLNEDSVPAVSSSNLEMMKHFLLISDYFKVCKVNREPIGFLTALLPAKDYNSEHYQWFNDKYDSFIYVDRIIFNKSYQNQGYGIVFYDDLINSIKNKSLDIACEINTKPYNKQSINFHKKYGFKEVGRKDINIEKSVIYMIYENK